MARDTPEHPLPPARLPTQAQVRELLSGPFAESGYDIEDVRVQAALRPPRIVVVADSDDGLGLDAVAALSRTASELLDSYDSDADPYVLEVTSPGIDRPLTTAAHYRRARGRKVDLRLTDGSSLQGRVGQSDGAQLDLVLADRGKLSVHQVAIADIAKAVVQVEFSPPNRRELELAGVSRVSDEEVDE